MQNYNQLSDSEKQILIRKLYIVERNSFEAIATMYGTYPNKVRRDAIRLGFAVRSRSEAQRQALELGRHKHPTKGTKRDEETKAKIGVSVMKSWKDLDPEKIKDRREKARENWEKLSEDQKAERFKKANEAIRQTSKAGSKLEKYLYETLLENGYRAEPHKEQVLSNTKLHIDIFLPENNIAIEVDGPSHFEPVWGELALKKAQEYDNKKNGLLLGKGLKIIRVRQTKDFSKTRADLVAKKLLKSIEKIIAEDTNYMEIGDE